MLRYKILVFGLQGIQFDGAEVNQRSNPAAPKVENIYCLAFHEKVFWVAYDTMY